MTASQRVGRKPKGGQVRKLQPRKLRRRKKRDIILLTQYAMTRKANDANFFVEKYAIARDATPFEKDAQALFRSRAPSSVNYS